MYFLTSFFRKKALEEKKKKDNKNYEVFSPRNPFLSFTTHACIIAKTSLLKILHSRGPFQV